MPDPLTILSVGSSLASIAGLPETLHQFFQFITGRRRRRKEATLDHYIDWLSKRHQGVLDELKRSAEAQRDLRQLLDGSRSQNAAGFRRLLETLEGLQRGQAELSRDVKNIPGALLDELRNEQERVRSEEDKEYDEIYREAVISDLDHVELFGVDQLSTESQTQRLTHAYVSLSLTGVGDEEAGTGPAPAEQVFDTLTTDTGRLLIRGEAGYGKTTLMQWAAIQAAGRLPSRSKELSAGPSSRARDLLQSARRQLHKDLPNPMDFERVAAMLGMCEPWYNRVPFFIRIRECKRGRLPKLEEFPFQVATLTKQAPEDWTHRVLDQGLGLVLIDGVDETPPSYRSVVRREVKQLVERYPDNCFVITTRPAAVELDWLAELDFREAVVEPLTTDAREALIDAWHRAVGHELAQRGRSEDTEALAQTLNFQLRENPPIALLARTPLLAAMICALHRDRRQHLPRKQRELVEALCGMMLYRREVERGVELEDFSKAYRELDYEQRRAMLQRLAAHMVRNDESTITPPHAKSLIANELESIPDRTPAEKSDVYQALVERSGMLRETRHGELDFIHNTFREYLAARQFVREGDVNTLADNADNGEWDNVLLFAAATSESGRFATDLIHKVIPSTSPKASDARRAQGPKAEVLTLYRRKMLVVRMRAVAMYLDSQLEQLVRAWERELVPPRTLTDAVALAQTGAGVERFLRYEPRMVVACKVACVRALRLLETPAALEGLTPYTCETDWRIVEELAQALNPLRIAEVVRRLQLDWDYQRFNQEEAVRQRIDDLAPLAGLSALQSLNLWGTHVSDLTPLAGLTGLQSLNLWGTQVSDLAPLAGLSGLQSLDLQDTHVSDLAPLAGLGGLQTLNLINTQVCDLAPLAKLRGLQSLYLGGAHVSDISVLARLNRLKALYLVETRVTDLSALSSLESLRELYVPNFNTQLLEPVSRLPKLKRIVVGRTPAPTRTRTPRPAPEVQVRSADTVEGEHAVYADLQNSARRVFISHSSKDKDFARKLVERLKQEKLDVWFDEQEIGVGIRSYNA